MNSIQKHDKSCNVSKQRNIRMVEPVPNDVDAMIHYAQEERIYKELEWTQLGGIPMYDTMDQLTCFRLILLIISQA